MIHKIDCPDNWDIKKVGELIDDNIIDKIKDGNHGNRHPKSNDFIGDDGIPFVTSNAVKKSKIFWEECKYINSSMYENLKKGFAESEDVLLTHKGSVGRTAVVPSNVGKIVLSPQVTYYRINNGIVPEYLMYFFMSKSFQKQIDAHSTQTTRDYIGLTKQMQTRLSIPPLSEQRRIASVLYSVDEQLEVLHERKDKLSTLKHGLMQDLLTGEKRVSPNTNVRDTVSNKPSNVKIGSEVNATLKPSEEPRSEELPDDWNLQNIEDVVEKIKDGGTPDRSKEDEYFGGSINWAVIKDVQFEIDDTTEKLTEKGLENSSAKLWPKGSVILTTGATIGKVGIALSPTATKQGISGMIPIEDKINNHYLARYLQSKETLLNRYSQGSTIKETRPPIVRKISIPVPPIGEQERIASILYTVDEMISNTGSQIEKLERLKRGLMQDLLSGDVRTPEELEVLEDVVEDTED